jgi:sugar lactone lactonase YvrE
MRNISALAGFLLTACLAAAFITGCNEESPSSCTDLSAAYVPCSDQPGTICTWAGTGRPEYGGNGGPPEDASLYWPIDLTFASDGRAYIADWNNHAIREVGLDGKVHTIIGGTVVGDGPMVGSTISDRTPPGAPGTEIALNHPTDVKELPDGQLLITCWHNHKLRHFDPSTGLVLVTCGAGNGFAGDGGSAASALLNQPSKSAIDATGNIYVLDQRNQRIRKIDTNGIITTVAGVGTAGFSGDGGAPLSAQFHFPAGPNPAPGGGLVFDSQGRLYVSDSVNLRIRRIDFNANTIETIAGTGEYGYSGDGGPALEAKFAYPFDLDFGPDGRLYVADQQNHRVRAIDLTTGTIATVAGNGTPCYSGDGGPAVDASLYEPSGIAFDAAGHLYIADLHNSRIRRVTL